MWLLVKRAGVFTVGFMVMPFGKYVGTELCALPDPYLEWLLSIELRHPLKRAVLAEARARKRQDRPQVSRTILVGDAELARRVVDDGYRSLALATHPDVGGSTADMQRLNQVVATLRKHLA